jgi:hypothetical protein
MRRYFINSNIAKKDFDIFSIASPHYVQFVARTNNLDFNSLSTEEKGVSRAITYTNR